MHDGEIDLATPQAVDHLYLAAGRLDGVRGLMLEFGNLPQGQGLDIDHFLDVQRQFGVHWENDDVPASAAQDTEFLQRDLILGIDFPGYEHHVRRMYPALLDSEIAELEALLPRRRLPDMVFDHVGVGPGDLRRMPADQVRELVVAHPVLVALYLLLRVNGNLAGSHLRLIMKFLFKPMKARARAGIPDSDLVANYAGTTGMIEKHLTDVTNARKRHCLLGLARTPVPTLIHDAGLPPEPRVARDQLADLARFTCPT